MVDKASIALHYLLNGNKLLYNKYYIRLFKPGETIPLITMDGVADGYWMGALLEANTGERYVGFTISLENFLDYCNNLTKDQVAIMASCNVLQDIKNA